MIEKYFELKFLLKYIVSFIAGFALVLSILFFALPHKDVAHYYEAVYLLSRTNSFLFTVFLIAGIAELAFTGIIIIFLSIMMSHKLAGSLYRLEKTLEYTAAGDLTRTMRLRHCDPVKDLALAFNHACKNIINKFKLIEKAGDSVFQAGKDLDGNKKSINKFREKISDLEKEFEIFKL